MSKHTYTEKWYQHAHCILNSTKRFSDAKFLNLEYLTACANALLKNSDSDSAKPMDGCTGVYHMRAGLARLRLLSNDNGNWVDRKDFDATFLSPTKMDELFGNTADSASSDPFGTLADTIKLASAMKLPSAGNKSDFSGYVLNRLKERGCFVDTHFGTDFPCNCEQVDETLNPQTPESGENHE